MSFLMFRMLCLKNRYCWVKSRKISELDFNFTGSEKYVLSLVRPLKETFLVMNRHFGNILFTFFFKNYLSDPLAYNNEGVDIKAIYIFTFNYIRFGSVHKGCFLLGGTTLDFVDQRNFTPILTQNHLFDSLTYYGFCYTNLFFRRKQRK